MKGGVYRMLTMRPALVHPLNCTYFLRQRKIDLITSKNNSL